MRGAVFHRTSMELTAGSGAHGTLVELSHILVLEDGQDQRLVLVQELLDSLRRDHLRAAYWH